MPRQTTAPEWKQIHPSIRPSQAAPLAIGTTCGAIHLPGLSRWRGDVFLPARLPPARVFVPHPQACSAIRAWTHPSCGRLLARRTGLLRVPSIPLACGRPSRPEAGPATLVFVSGTLSHFRGGSAECDRRSADGTSQTSGRDGPLLLRAFLRTSARWTGTHRATRPRTPHRSDRLPLPRQWQSPESLFPTNPSTFSASFSALKFNEHKESHKPSRQSSDGRAGLPAPVVE